MPFNWAKISSSEASKVTVHARKDNPDSSTWVLIDSDDLKKVNLLESHGSHATVADAKANPPGGRAKN